VQGRIAALERVLDFNDGWRDDWLPGAIRVERTTAFFELYIYSEPAIGRRAATFGYEVHGSRGLGKGVVPLDTGEAASFGEAKVAGQMALARVFAKAAVAAELDAKKTAAIEKRMKEEVANDAR